MNQDTFLEIVKRSELPEIHKLCASNKLFNQYCKDNSEYIYQYLIKRDFPGRETESAERKYKRMWRFKNNKPTMMDEWYTGIDQSYRLLDIPMYRDEPEKIHEILDTMDVNVNVKSKYSLTPLMLAIEYSTPDTTNKLLDKGADVNQQTKGGDTPLSLAKRFSTKEVIERINDKVEKILGYIKDDTLYIKTYNEEEDNWKSVKCDKMGKAKIYELSKKLKIRDPEKRTRQELCDEISNRLQEKGLMQDDSHLYVKKRILGDAGLIL
jgi:Ankyrin repeats (many copies)